MKRGKAYARYRAVIGVLTMKGDLLVARRRRSGVPHRRPICSIASAAAPAPAA